MAVSDWPIEPPTLEAKGIIGAEPESEIIAELLMSLLKRTIGDVQIS